MKKMTTRYIVLCAAILLASCSDFLTEKPKVQLVEEDLFTDDKKIGYAVDGLLTQWRNTRQDRGALILCLGTDESQQGGQQVRENSTQAALDKYDAALDAPNSTIADLWNKRWPIIATAAKVYHFATSNELKAYGAFLRGTLTFESAMFWGEVPLISVENNRQARQPLADVYASIISDLEFAGQYLPEEQTDLKRPTRYAALALLGKVYMAIPEGAGTRDYAKALEYFDQVIPHYTLVSDYKRIFDAEQNQNLSESIYSFQFRNAQPDNSMAEHHAGSRAVANLDGNVYFGGYDLALPTEYYYSDVEDGGVWEAGDTRKLASIRYDLTLPDGRVPTLTWTGQQDELGPHTRKFEDIRTNGKVNFWNGGSIMPYLRLADILLCKGECLNELDQTGAAVDLVNTTVRTRAFGGSLTAEQTWSTGMSQSDFRVNILDERMRELAFEGWRRMDLIRTNNLVSLVKARNIWAGGTDGRIDAHHVLYPIPDTEIKLNEFIDVDDQNPGY
ncbi:RagB/SusD family nutrient uptake outer membrane protein [Fulvivirgaceae bacterium PWU5]|uniref:RagB/SusD family nutrient uptake outer membrane protein n=1 Tax=Dawidia cretensis TaxID=2782350 RepID=A0AAP2GWV4_9BACT|nr:RagB/SusD family nutrient uptake outer membrane protein [Dawidia cretensis]MBT1711507.1 RagB/SusD family nutrient uptake outer membrane protein [Dawidia cretensis]